MTREQMAAVFNEWARQFAADPAAFGPILDEQGQPVVGYGESCAIHFERIANELSAR